MIIMLFLTFALKGLTSALAVQIAVRIVLESRLQPKTTGMRVQPSSGLTMGHADHFIYRPKKDNASDFIRLWEKRHGLTAYSSAFWAF